MTSDDVATMDEEVAAIDLKIGKKKVKISLLEDEVDKLLKTIQRHKAELRALGHVRAEKGTFQLGL